MATRYERVIVDLDDRLTGPIARTAAATALFRREVDSSGKSLVDFDRKSEATGLRINKLSDRLGVLARAAAALGPGLVPITTAAVPAIAGLANQLGFAAAGAGTAVLAFNGVGKALETLNTYQLEPTAENAAKVAEQMRGLGPAAQEFVRFLDQIGPQMQGIRVAAQEGLLPGVQDSLEQMTNRLPQVRMIVSEIAEASAELARATGSDLGSARWNEFFAFLDSEARPTLMAFGQTVGHLASGMAELWMAFAPLSGDFSAGLLRMAEGFERWAAGLDQTQGFADFLAYVRQTGPQVLDLLGSLVDMLIQVGTAVAPLGGPVLTILTKLADVIATIAASDLGTPLLGAVSAMSALSLATRGFVTAMGTPAAARVKSIGAAAPSIGQLGTAFYRAGQSAKYASAETLRAREAVHGFGRQVGPAAGLMAGLTVAATGLGQGMGIANTASMALMGTIAGPWGAAVGAAAGLTLDLAAVNDDLVDTLERTNAALRDGDLSLSDQAAALRTARDAVSDYRTALDDVNLWDPAVFKNTIEGVFGRSDIEEAESALAELEQQFRRNYNEVQANDRALGSLSGVLDENRDGFVTNTDAIMANVRAMEDLRDANLRAMDAEYAYEASLLDVQDRLKRRKELLRELAEAESPEDRKRIREELENYRLTLDKTTRAGQENWQALRNQAAAWNNLDGASQNARGAFASARQELFNTARQFGAMKAEAREYVRQLLEIPPRRVTAVEAQTSAAEAAIARVRAALDALRDKRVIVTTEQHTIARSPVAIARADGGSVPGQRHPYGDKVLAMLAPGEEVITNRNGQADRFRADRAAGRIPHYADGGTVRGYAAGGRVDAKALGAAWDGFSITVDMNTAEVRRELRALQQSIRQAGGTWTDSMGRMADRLMATSEALDEQRDALDGAKDALRDMRQAAAAFKTEVASNFKSDLFGEISLPDAFDALDPATRQLHIETIRRNRLINDIADADAMKAALRKASRGGLDGALFRELAASGDVAAAQQFAAMSRREINQYERLYAQRSSAAASVGAFASQAGFGAALVDQTREVRELRRDVRALISDQTIARQAAAQGRATARALDKTAAGAQRSKR